MKRDCTSLLLATLLCCVSAFLLQAQESINPLAPCSETATLQSPLQMQTRSTNAYDGGSSTVYPFSDKDQQQRIYALAVNLSVTFTEEDGYFSILLEDQTGEQYLVYRDIAIFNTLNTAISLPFKSFETALLPNGVYPRKLILYTAGCRVNLEKVSTATTPDENYRPRYQLLRLQRQKQKTIQTQIDRINDYNKKHGILWIAKQTSLSLRPYAENRQNLSFFSEVEAYGLEYYGGGIYTPMAIPFDQLEFLDTTTDPYVEYFDWSDRHGINWNTSCREQYETSSCWAQATASAMESYIKRYYGENVDRQVSVLQIIACSGALEEGCTDPEKLQKRKDKCGPIWPSAMPLVAQYLKQPIVSEEEFPFVGKKYQPCKNKPKAPSFPIR